MTKKKSRGSYTRISQAEKAAVAKYANENGVGNAVKHFKEKNVKESSVMHLYQKKLKEKCKVTGPDENYVVLELPERKHGRPHLLGFKIDKCLQVY